MVLWGRLSINDNKECRSRRLFLPVHLLLMTPQLSDTRPVSGDIEFRDDRVMRRAVDGRSGTIGLEKMRSRDEKTLFDVINATHVSIVQRIISAGLSRAVHP